MSNSNCFDSKHSNFLRGIISAFLIMFLYTFLPAQELMYKEGNVGFNIGANFALGSHFQRMGLNFTWFYVNNNLQLNSEIRTYHNFKNLGPKKPHNEMVLSQGINFGYGAKQNYFNPFLSSVSNQTGYQNAIAYSYNFYFNKIKTRQVTGIIALQFNSFSIITENDILAKPTLDRFRTGAFLIQYQYKDVYQASVNCSMWTGAMGRVVRNDAAYMKRCYVDTTGGTYTQYSHGLLSAQIRYHMGLSQNVQANLGVDAEQVRNFVQNKVIHDAFFLPRSWFKRNNCYLPMLDENNRQYLYKPDQKIKQPELYLNIFANSSVFY